MELVEEPHKTPLVGVFFVFPPSRQLLESARRGAQCPPLLHSLSERPEARSSYFSVAFRVISVAESALEMGQPVFAPLAIS